MAIINIDTERLKSINSDIATLDNTLINNYIPALESELQAIYGNIQNAEVRGIINTINEKISTITSSLKSELPRLEEFLDTQITSYQLSVDEAEAALTAAVSKMATISGATFNEAASSNTSEDESTAETGTSETSAETSTEASAETSETSTEDMNYFERANAEAAEGFTETWNAYADSFSNYYQNTAKSDGVIDAVGNAVIDTVEAAVGTVWNTGTFLVNGAVDAVEWVGDVVFGDSVLGGLWNILF